MLPSSNASSVSGSPRVNFLLKNQQTQNRLSQRYLGASNGSQSLTIDIGTRPNASKLEAELPAPVLACSTFVESHGDFVDQAHLEREWSALKDYLRSTTLCEQEALEVLNSGILQTETGKTLAGLLADALMRSRKPVGELTHTRLQEIVKVICHLPPTQWQSALGENTRLISGPNAEGVAGFVQKQLDLSNVHRDERIANGGLVEDGQWEAIKQIVQKARSYIRGTGSTLDGKLMMLEDMCDVRPTPDEARQALSELIHELKNPAEEVRKRWHPRFPEAVEAVLVQIGPAETIRQTWLELVAGPRLLETFSQGQGAVLAMMTDSKPADACLPVEHSPTLLSRLQTIERNADFFSNVTLNGPRIPEGIAGKILYACNVLDTFGALKLDHSHISMSGSSPEPSKQAWKNGASELARQPFAPVPEQPQEVPPSLSQFAAQFDDVVRQIVGKVMPWDSVYADTDTDTDTDTVLDIEGLMERLPAYQATTVALDGEPSVSLRDALPDMEGLKEQLQSWLGRMSGTLISTGVAVMSRTGDLIERNPGRSAAAFSLYVALSNLYAQWFLPEPETVEPSHLDVSITPQDPTDILNDVEELFADEPDFAEAVARLVSQSEYLDPSDDPQLFEDIEALLRQPFPGIQNATYLSYLEAIAAQEAQEALDESGEESDAATELPIDVLLRPFPDDVAISGARVKRSLESGTVDKKIVRAVIEYGAIEVSVSVAMHSKDEIAPGFTLKQAVDKIYATFEAAAEVADPVTYIKTSASALFSEASTASDKKAGINPDTVVEVRYLGLDPRTVLGISPTKNFTLTDLCINTHRKGVSLLEWASVVWPDGISEQLKTAIKNADFQESYRTFISSTLSRPDVTELWKLTKEREIESVVKQHLSTGNCSAGAAKIANDFLSGNVSPNLAFANSRRGFYAAVPISNAVYLAGGPHKALLVLLGGEGKVVELSYDSAPKYTPEALATLKKDIEQRIALKYNHNRVDDDYVSALPVTAGQAGYEPFITTTIPPEAVMNLLHLIQVEKVLLDIDTLVATDGELLTDTVLTISGHLLQAISIGVGLIPMAGTAVSAAACAAAALLLGIAFSGMDALRAIVADDPAIAEEHRNNALFGAVSEFAGPLAGKLVGKSLSRLSRLSITRSVLQRFRAKGLSKTIVKQSKGIPKWLAPKVKDYSDTLRSMQLKFKNAQVFNRLNHLGDGPHIAQKLMDKARHVYFSGAKDGYVYKGFVMRGDMQPPKEVFKNGFKLRTPITDVKQVNGMKGGFGGGKDALDMDGMGISTSAYYKDSGAGAFYYGGGRGGYTYVIDGRKLKGYDLYKNHNFGSANPSKLGFKPLEINYGKDIPAGMILGAYDSKGVFFPNPKALQNSMKQSIPDLDLGKGQLLKPLLKSNLTSLPRPK
ncbi:hypothetical protein CRX42_06455 [Pseudomonas jessenii]|uniref:Uncharacterized protein n=1 Tax=Pseudomonas jessenii TaxID=77298 RepID=A0A2W0EU05_PSEJE|nr:hypothetical protein [Pseudomonas jessenii]PYY71386.1 hypothetical protein CRX42_06455 [Pseudomonas jessenii]